MTTFRGTSTSSRPARARSMMLPNWMRPLAGLKGRGGKGKLPPKKLESKLGKRGGGEGKIIHRVVFVLPECRAFARATTQYLLLIPTREEGASSGRCWASPSTIDLHSPAVDEIFFSLTKVRNGFLKEVAARRPRRGDGGLYRKGAGLHLKFYSSPSASPA